MAVALALFGAARALLPSQAIVGNRWRTSSKTLLNYEVMEALSPGFEAQLAACAGVVLSGSYFDSQTLIAPATSVMVEVNDNDEDLSKLVEKEDKEVDIYRDTALRYAGYLNEIGEAFRPVVPSSFVTLSYVLAITYVLADARSKGAETANNPLNDGISGCGAAAIIDTLAFQFVASIIIPGTIINRWVSFCSYLTFKEVDVSNLLSYILHRAPTDILTTISGVDITCDSIASTCPTALGLALIPFIVAPIDALTEKFLDEVVRPPLVKACPDCYLPFDENDEDAFGREKLEEC